MALVGAVEAAIRACRRSYNGRIIGNLCPSIFLPDQSGSLKFHFKSTAAKDSRLTSFARAAPLDVQS